MASPTSILSTDVFEWVKVQLTQHRNDTLLLRELDHETGLGQYRQVVREGDGKKRRWLSAFIGSDHGRTDVDLFDADDRPVLNLWLRRKKGYWINVRRTDGTLVGQVLDGRQDAHLFVGPTGRLVGMCRHTEGRTSSPRVWHWALEDAEGEEVGEIFREPVEGVGWGTYLANTFGEAYKVLDQNRLHLQPGTPDPLATLAKVMPVAHYLLRSVSHASPFDETDPTTFALAVTDEDLPAPAP